MVDDKCELVEGSSLFHVVFFLETSNSYIIRARKAHASNS